MLRSRRASHPSQGFIEIMCLETEIKSHSQRVESGERPFYGKICPCCGAQGPYHVRECRRRWFRLVVGGYVKVLRSWILRWKCAACGKRFTDYPPFRLTPQAVREADAGGKVESLSGWRRVLPEVGSARRDSDSVRRSAGVRRRHANGPASRTGSQQSVAVALLAGQFGQHSTCGLRVDSAEGTRQHTTSGSVGDLTGKVSVRRAAEGAPAGDAMDRGRAAIRGSVRQGNLPPLCNSSRLAVS